MTNSIPPLNCGVIGPGMLGSDLIAQLKALNLPVSVYDYPVFDITNTQSIAAALSHDHDVIFNCSAYTLVDAAEEQQDTAFAINGTGPGLLAAFCEQHDMHLIHISTDYVFNGQNTSPYQPKETTDPVNVYGASKLAGELAIAKVTNNYLIIRTQWLYGHQGPNFVETMSKLMTEHDSLKVVDDQCGSPTYTVDLAEAMITLALQHQQQPIKQRILHFTNSGHGTWCDFAKAIHDKLVTANNAGDNLLNNNKKTLRCKAILPCTTSEFPRPAPRPAYSVLDTSEYTILTKKTIRPWQDALQAYMTAKRI